MKKAVLLLGLICCLFFITACSNSRNTNIIFKEDPEHDITTGTTYKFVGQSEHFGFETGKVFYDGNTRQLLISNFKLIKEIKNIDSYTLKLYFNDKSLFTDEETKIGSEGIEKHLKDIVIGENGKLGEKDANGNIIGESDAFLETTKETFKNSIKLQIKYCNKEDCKTETLVLNYVQVNNSINVSEKSKYEVSDNLVSLRVKEGSLTNSKATLILENHIDENYEYGYPYSIECEKDGIWYKVIPLNDLNFNLPAFGLKSKDSVEIEIDWEYHYGKLPTGKYRVIKDVDHLLDTPKEPNNESPKYEQLHIASEFIIK